MNIESFLSVGTFVAAIIAAALGVLSYRRSAKQIIAGYRLDWLQKLRDNIANLSHLAAVMNVKIELEDEKGAMEVVNSIYLVLPQIELLLIDETDAHQAKILNSLEKLQIAMVPEAVNDTIGTVNVELREAFRLLCKHEWTRIKKEVEW